MTAAPGPTERIVAASDCEECRDGWITQPVNAVSSLAYVVAGGLLVRRARRTSPGPTTGSRWPAVYGWSVAAVGVGSVAYHGPAGAWARRLHDASIVALGATVVLSDAASRRSPDAGPGPLMAAVPALAALSVHRSTTSTVAQATVGAVATVAEVVTAGDGAGPAWARRASVPVWATGLAVHALGRTGGPLCRPGSPWQPHAAWHLLSAAGLWLRGLTRS